MSIFLQNKFLLSYATIEVENLSNLNSKLLMPVGNFSLEKHPKVASCDLCCKTTNFNSFLVSVSRFFDFVVLTSIP